MMGKSKFTETQIVIMIIEAESGVPIHEMVFAIVVFTSGAQCIMEWSN